MGRVENAHRPEPRLSFHVQPGPEAQDGGGSREMNQPGCSQRQQTAPQLGSPIMGPSAGRDYRHMPPFEGFIMKL